MSTNSYHTDLIKKIRGTEKERHTVVGQLANDDILKQKVKSYILKNNGDSTDAKTVFNDMIVTFIKTVFAKKEFELSSHPHAYLIGVAKFLWMNELRKKGRHKTSSLENITMQSTESNHLDLMLKGERATVLGSILGLMKKNCKDVLMYWSAGFNMTEIAKKVGYKSEGVARKKKSECMKELNSYLTTNPHIKNRLRLAK